MRRIEALTGDGADALVRERVRHARRGGGRRRRPVGRGRPGPDRGPSRRSSARPAAGSRPAAAPRCPKPGELAARSRGGRAGRSPRGRGAAVRLDGRAEGRGQGRPARSSAPGVIALALDADEPQLFVTVSDDLVARGHLGRRPGQRGACRRSTARAAAGPRWPRARARVATGSAERPGAADPAPRLARAASLMAFLRRIWQRDDAGGRWPPARPSTSGPSSPRPSSSTSTPPGTARSAASGASGRACPTCSRAPSPTSPRSSTTAPSRSRRPRRWPASGRRQVVIGIAGELVKGFTTTHIAGAQEARPADHRKRAPEADRRRPARGAPGGRAGDHLGDRPAERRRPARARGGHAAPRSTATR